METLGQIAQFFEGAGTWLAVPTAMGILGIVLVAEAIIHKLKGMYKTRRTRKKKERKEEERRTAEEEMVRQWEAARMAGR